ncbi:hypothetical protein Lal_00003791 [Lupinus albus]|nr:hypothetical protein Lal_00003791 [Lupinus albus]
MAKGKYIRVAVILECTSCSQNSSVNKQSTESTQYAQLIGIEKILSPLLQTYDSRRNKEIDKMDRFCVTLPKEHENDQFFIYIL